jgi:hypothetical protein
MRRVRHSAGFRDAHTQNTCGNFDSVRLDALCIPRSRCLRRAELQQSWSQYAQTRDGDRSTVLGSSQEVEDGLSLTQRLARDVVQQREASDQATQALTISTMLYDLANAINLNAPEAAKAS